MEHNFEKLRAAIINLSNSDEFYAAKKEWEFVGIEISDDLDNCLCGHTIKEICHIKNQLNGKVAHVGNVCINQFLGIQTGNIFDGLKRIIKDNTANPNEDLINYARKFGYIYENEYKFLIDTKRKRILSPKQLEWKLKINRRIIKQIPVNETTLQDAF